MKHLNMEELQEGLTNIRNSPDDNGKLELIVRRPDINQREVMEEAYLNTEDGLTGDNWKIRGSSKTPDKSAHPDMQLNIMNSRAISLIATEKERWPLAGDQLYIDLNLNYQNLAPGTRLKIGEAVIQVTDMPHTGCKKFVERFGLDAMNFVNSELGRELNLRGINAKVIVSGKISAGDLVSKL